MGTAYGVFHTKPPASPPGTQLEVLQIDSLLQSILTSEFLLLNLLIF